LALKTSIIGILQGSLKRIKFLKIGLTVISHLIIIKARVFMARIGQWDDKIKPIPPGL